MSKPDVSLDVPRVASSLSDPAAATVPTATPQLDEASDTAATGALADHARRHFGGDLGALSDPGFRLDVEGGFRRSASAGLVGSDLMGDAPLSFLPPALEGAGSVRLRSVFPLGGASRPDDQRATLSVGARANASALIDTTGVDRSVAIVNQASAAYTQAKALGSEIGTMIDQFQSSATVQRLRELAAKAQSGAQLSLAEVAEGVALASDLEAEMRAASTKLAELPRLFDDLEDTVDALGDGALQMRVDALASGYAAQTLGARSPTFRIGREGRHLLDFAAELQLVEPMPMPGIARDALGSMNDLVQLRSAMVAIRSYVDIQVHGLTELKESIGQAREDAEVLRGSLDATADDVGAAAANPASLASTGSGLETSIAALQSQGEALGTSAGLIAGGLTFETEAGVEIAQPTASVGLGLSELSLRYRYRPSDSTELALRAYVENLTGVMDGVRDRLRYDPTSGEFVHVAHEEGNVYHDFFPTIAGLDVGLSLGRGSAHETQLLAGVGVGRGAIGAHLGLQQRIVDRFGFHLGISDPNLAASEGHMLLPQAGLRFDLGSGEDPSSVALALSGGVAARWAADARGDLHGGIDGGQGGVTLNITR